MSEKNRFFKSGIMLTLVALSMRTVSMFFSAYISRAVGAEGIGLYTIVMTVYSFAVTLATSGVSLTVTRLVASAIGEEKRGDVSRILRGALLYSSLFGIAATLLLLFGADIIGNLILMDFRTVTSLRALAFSLLPIALSSVFSGYFVGVKRVGFNAATQIFAQAVKITITVLLVSLTADMGLVASVSALCVGITLTELFAFALVLLEFLIDRRRHGERGEKGRKMKDVAKMAVPLALSAYVRSVLLSVEHVLIPKRLRDRGESSSEAYAHYGILHGMAVPLILYPMTPLSSFSGLLVPEFAEGKSAGQDKRISNIATRALNTTLVYATLAAVLIFFFSSELGYAFYNSFDAGMYVAMLAPVLPIMYLDHVTDAMLKGIGEQVYSMWVNISDSLLSVFLVWFLIPRLGITGYALVIVIMEGYNFILSFFRLKKKISFEISIFKSLLFPAVIALLSSRIANELFAFSGSGISIPWMLLKMIFAISLFFLFFYLGKIITGLKKKKAVNT